MAMHSNPFVTETEVPRLNQQILIIEDEAVFAGAVRKRLTRAGYQADIAGTLAAGAAKLKEATPDLLLLDMRLPDGSGLDFLADLQGNDANAFPVLVMSAYGEIEDAVSAMKSGASDYLKKPIDLDELLLVVARALEQNELSQKLTYSSKREQHAHEGADFLGESSAIKAVRQQIERLQQVTAASAPPTILILGETGTGKDVVARRLHADSARGERPFVHVDCASLPKDLIEAELFGHEKGAFTSAHTARTGLIEAAEDGVLFMDEIGELPMDLQAKLLAVLERRTLRKVGATRERPVAAWIIAATNRDIEELARRGEFRSDLYYRLNVLSITLAPLRERGADVLLLAQHFMQQNARRYGIPALSLSAAAAQALRSYHWPGNVRELKHIIERAVLLSGGGELAPENLALSTPAQPDTETGLNLSPGADTDLTLGDAELMLIKNALEKCQGNVSKAARELGITRMALRYRIQKYNLE
ncbi:MAG: sigma-54 dependent transcriptional regulator [Gammaproteobacteria bacterium]|nr:sigma-54 dependent transcriptional regulator [Gammaproteobacteria bacterium]MCY4281576.1 sigma-54 dependent transcriptional regulator [Gammaproteobacteria bacterium]MCY4338851.1 sigma-54 dependent transcriptional regulator [Gammaproteobacteria bacterium]